MKRINIWFMRAVLAVFLCAPPASATALELRPVDDAPKVTSFLIYRTALLEAVKRRDADYVVARAAESIKLSFGGQYGREMFRQSLTGTDDHEGESYWFELQAVLELGGVFLDDGAFCAPYVSCLDVPGCPECDPFETIFVTIAAAVAHAKPDIDSEIVANLSYDVLQIDIEKQYHGDWIPVRLPDGGAGYVKGRHFRMSIDYRARFEQFGKDWLMTYFIAGD